MLIKDKDHNIIIDAPITTAAKRNWELMTSNNVTLSFQHSDYIDIPKGSYVEYDGQRFDMIRNFSPEDLSDADGYKYEPIFDSPEYWLETRNIFYISETYREAVFTDTTNISGFGDILVANANAQLTRYTWSFYIDNTVDADGVKTLAFTGDNMLDAVIMIAEMFECEWWVTENSNAICIHFGKLEVGSAIALRKGEIITSVPARKGDDTDYGTRFYIYGSTRNLTSEYGQANQGGATNHISEVRLRLPNGQDYIDAIPDLSDEDVIEKFVTFEDVYPKNTDTVTGVTTTPRVIEDADEDEPDSFTAYIIQANDSPFTEDDIIAGEDIMVVFEDGVLAGWEFQVDELSDYANNKFELVSQHEEDGNGGIQSIPNDVLKPAVGDKFILAGVKLPTARQEEAEAELLTVGTNYATENSSDTELYECPTNPVYCQNNDYNFPKGQRVTLHHPRFGDSGRSSRIQAYSKSIWNPYICTYTIGDNAAYSKTGSIASDVSAAAYAERLGVNSGTGIYLITKYDTTEATDFNTFSAAHILAKYARLGKDVNFATALITDGLVVRDTFKGPDIISTLGDAIKLNKAVEVDGGILIKKDGETYLETLDNYLAIHKSFGEENAVSGFAGAGLMYDNVTKTFSVDNLVVRKGMSVYELIINKIRATNGSLWVSDAAEIIGVTTEMVDGVECWKCEVDSDAGMPFMHDDWIRCQQFGWATPVFRLIAEMGGDLLTEDELQILLESGATPDDIISSPIGALLTENDKEIMTEEYNI